MSAMGLLSSTGCVAVGAAGSEEVLVRDLALTISRPGMNRIVDVDDQWRSRLCQCGPNLGGELAVGDYRLGLAMRQNIGDSRGIEARVDGVEHRTQHRHGVMRLQHRGHVGQHDRDGIARADATSRKRGCQSPHPLVELAIAESPCAMDNGDAVGVDFGRSRQERHWCERREIGGVGPQAIEQSMFGAAALAGSGRRHLHGSLGGDRTINGLTAVCRFRHAAGGLAARALRADRDFPLLGHGLFPPHPVLRRSLHSDGSPYEPVASHGPT